MFTCSAVKLKKFQMYENTWLTLKIIGCYLLNLRRLPSVLSGSCLWILSGLTGPVWSKLVRSWLGSWILLDVLGNRWWFASLCFMEMSCFASSTFRRSIRCRDRRLNKCNIFWVLCPLAWRRYSHLGNISVSAAAIRGYESYTSKHQEWTEAPALGAVRPVPS